LLSSFSALCCDAHGKSAPRVFRAFPDPDFWTWEEPANIDESTMEKLLRLSLILSLISLSAMQLFPEDFRSRRPAAPDKNSITFSVNVGLVVLPTTVLDKSGRFVSGLEEENFEILEDGEKQHIQIFDHKDIPVAVGLIIDSSSSMVPKRTDVIAAALKLAESSNPEDQIFVVHFNELISFALRLGQAFTSDLEELRTAAGNISGTGRTSLYDAVVEGLEHVQTSKLQRKALVVVSDGGDNSSRHTLKQVLDLASASNAVIYAIGIYDEYDRDSNPKVLKKIASITGGEAFFPRNSSQLSETCDRIAKDVRSQYTLGYIPSNQSRDGKYRSIRVSVKSRDMGPLTVRTRSGYVAQREAPDAGFGIK
jgi:Ca-activated chloride channel family protein